MTAWRVLSTQLRVVDIASRREEPPKAKNHQRLVTGPGRPEQLPQPTVNISAKAKQALTSQTALMLPEDPETQHADGTCP